MTNGTSQGLFVIVAVIIFGIFIAISYLLFGTTMKNGLTGVFCESFNQVSEVSGLGKSNSCIEVPIDSDGDGELDNGNEIDDIKKMRKSIDNAEFSFVDDYFIEKYNLTYKAVNKNKLPINSSTLDVFDRNDNYLELTNQLNEYPIYMTEKEYEEYLKNPLTTKEIQELFEKEPINLTYKIEHDYNSSIEKTDKITKLTVRDIENSNPHYGINKYTISSDIKGLEYKNNSIRMNTDYKKYSLPVINNKTQEKKTVDALKGELNIDIESQPIDITYTFEKNKPHKEKLNLTSSINIIIVK